MTLTRAGDTHTLLLEHPVECGFCGRRVLLRIEPITGLDLDAIRLGQGIPGESTSYDCPHCHQTNRRSLGGRLLKTAKRSRWWGWSWR